MSTESREMSPGLTPDEFESMMADFREAGAQMKELLRSDYSAQEGASSDVATPDE